MCLAFVAIQPNSRYALVIASNRDEFFNRPTEAVHFWPREGDGGVRIIGGRDTVGGGTWLGLSTAGRFALVTNFAEPEDPKAPVRSRGGLPVEFLRSSLSPLEYCKLVSESAAEYAGFNLIVGDVRAGQHTAYTTNRDSDASGGTRAMGPGLYGLSNALLDCGWPKVERGKDVLGALLSEPGPLDPARVLDDVLGDRTVAPDDRLPSTGKPLYVQRALSAACVSVPSLGYGTRSSSVVLVTRGGATEWTERAWQDDGSMATQTFTFDLDM